MGFLWVLKKENIFPLESLKNIREPPQISMGKYEELGMGGVVVCVCCIFLFKLNSVVVFCFCFFFPNWTLCECKVIAKINSFVDIIVAFIK